MSRGQARNRGGAAHAAGARVTIDRLSLKLPAGDAESARRIVQRATELAADRVPSSLSGRLAKLELRVHPRDLSESSVSESIAEALVAALRGQGGKRA